MAVAVPTWSRGERLAKARKDAGLSQDKMAELLGVSPKTVAAWEVNRNQARGFMEKMARWAEITEVPLWWLLDLQEQPSRWFDVHAGQPTLDQALWEQEAEARRQGTELVTAA